MIKSSNQDDEVDNNKSDGENEEDDNSLLDNEFNKDEVNECRQQLQAELCFSGETKANDSIRRYIESCSQYLSDMRISESIVPDNATSNDYDHDNFVEVEVLNHSNDCDDVGITNDCNDVNNDISDEKCNKDEFANIETASKLETEKDDEFFDALSTITGCVENEDDVIGKLDPNSRMYRLKMVEKLLNDTRSQRSYSTSASTIAPSVITERIRRNLDKKEKQMERKRCVAKGEASAVHRHRKENKDIVKEYRGWEF